MSLASDRLTKLFFKPALLLTESYEDIDVLRASIDAQIRPSNVIECIFAADVAILQWEILRLHRCKAQIVNVAFRRALKSLLRPHFETNGEADDVVERWFTEPESKDEVRKVLARHNLDELAIEAEALRLSVPDLERVDRVVAALESRRNRAIGCVYDFRASSKQCRKRSNRLFKSNEIRSLEGRSSKRTD